MTGLKPIRQQMLANGLCADGKFSGFFVSSPSSKPTRKAMSIRHAMRSVLHLWLGTLVALSSCELRIYTLLSGRPDRNQTLCKDRSPTMNVQMTMQATTSLDIQAKVGVLMYDSTVEVDEILATSVGLIRTQGVVAAGLLQRFGDRLPNGKRSMWVDDIATGTTVRLDQQRGPGAVACMLDADALAQCACLLENAIRSQPDLIIVSRFGNAEADGGGMRAEIAEAICSGAVVLIPVKFSLLNDLEGFLGSPVTLLLPSPMAIADWATSAVFESAAAYE